MEKQNRGLKGWQCTRPNIVSGNEYIPLKVRLLTGGEVV